MSFFCHFDYMRFAVLACVRMRNFPPFLKILPDVLILIPVPKTPRYTLLFLPL